MSPRRKLVYPVIEPVQGSESLYVVMSDFSLTLDDGSTLWIRAGFRFNGGSIPRVAWPVVGHPFSGKCLVAYLAHDALYGTHYTSRDYADEALSQLLRRYNVAALRRGAIWSAVRLFGGWAWGEANAQSIAHQRLLVQYTL